MGMNPVLKALGFSAQDKVVIFHADDVGMCEATVSAYDDLLDAGALSSAALMVPCAFAEQAAEVAKQHSNVDLGVHLTLTSEWDKVRWGPVSTRDPATGLLDAEGFFPRTTQEIQANGTPEAVRAELTAQVKQALAWGVDATHVDSHMGAIAHPKFLPVAIDVAVQQGLPAMYPRMGVQGWRAQGFDAVGAMMAVQFGKQMERRKLPLVDQLYMLPLHEGGDHLEVTRQVLKNLPPGITHFILHPAKDTPELRSLVTDWPARVANYEAFRDPRMHRVIVETGVHVMGFRPLRERLRQLQAGQAVKG